MPAKHQAPTKQTLNPARAALYARVSSEEQREKATIKTQIAEAEKFRQQRGLTLVEKFFDEGVSGTVPFERRLGGKALLAAADKKAFDLVLVWKVSRLGRADVVSHVARHALESRGVGLVSITEPFDTSTPAGKFMFSILAAAVIMLRPGSGV
jgi:site-specific DNA recombinase